MSLPPTPIHPGPNEEVHVQLPTEKFDDADFDLNPDLYDDDDDDDDENNAIGATVTNGLEVKDDKAENEDEKNLNNQNNINFNANANGVDNGNGNGNDNNNDHFMENSNKYLESVTVPFDQGYEASLNEFTSPIILNEFQISKLINYIDEHLLQIQRKYIKTHIDGESQYTLYELLDDLSLLINIMWKPIINRNRLFGQPDYFIKILSDLEDYLNYYQIFTKENINSVIYQFFSFWQNIDLKISLLIDGYQSYNGIEKFNQTHMVRLIPIITRLRILIITKLDLFKMTLTSENHLIRNILEVEIGRLFEGILDRQ